MQTFKAPFWVLGSWVHFQLNVFFLLGALSVAPGCNFLSFIFLVSTPQHHCNILARSNLSEEWILASIPVVVDGQLRRSSCSRYELETVQTLSAMGIKPSLEQKDNSSTLESNSEVVLSSLKQEGCKDGWTYSTGFYVSSAVSDFDLVCSGEWKQLLTTCTYLLGGFVGCLISVQLSDNFGRKPVLFGAIAILSVLMSSLAFVRSWEMFLSVYYIVGVCQMTSSIVLFLLGYELVVVSPGAALSFLCIPIAYVFGMLLLPGTSYFIKNWRDLSLVLGMPGVVCMPLWWLIPESPRWLLSRGHMQGPQLLLSPASLGNQGEAPPVIFISVNDPVVMAIP